MLSYINLRNVGPFTEATLDLVDKERVADVVILTGENGGGKSIVIDSVRQVFGDRVCGKLRDLATLGSSEQAIIQIGWCGKELTIHTNNDRQFRGHDKFSVLRMNVGGKQHNLPEWVLDFWPSTISEGSYKNSHLEPMNANGYLDGALSSHRPNQQLSKFIVQVDYLRNSEDHRQAEYAETVWVALKEIARLALGNGELAWVNRVTQQPVFKVRDVEHPPENLNAGAAYMLQRMCSLVERMVGCYLTKGSFQGSPLLVPGLVIIDEPENHLHPRWQKRFIPIVRELFPNVQLLVATHSPFIVASVRDQDAAKYFVCTPGEYRANVEDVTADYSASSIAQVLASPAFAETGPFGDQVTALLERRTNALDSGDHDERERIEKLLMEMNPSEFRHFEIQSLLSAISKEMTNISVGNSVNHGDDS